ncbi:MAG: acyl-CoA/acyl-ACP dehydrogenase [Spirochaetales bacterium]|nr:acyl-CoA/acyl-ACP dehydrogenase [Spirochaetales bacterium]
MDFSFTDEQREIGESVLDLCEAKLNGNVFEDDETGTFSREKWNACARFGLPGLPVPEVYGGLGQNMLTTALAVEKLGYGCRDEGLVFSLCAHMLTCIIPLCRFGTEDQKEKYLPGLCNGEIIGGNGITEADAGSDTSSITTKAVRDKDVFLVSGAKIFVTNGPVAGLLVIYARHPGGMKMLDISALLVETGIPGFSIGQVFKKMGLRTSAMSEVVLDGCRVPVKNLLGRERMGMNVFNHSMLWERIIMAAYHVGAMEWQYESALGYAGLRKQFGRKIVKFGGVSDRLVDMKIRCETARLLLYKTCWDYDNGKADAAGASMLKLVASEARIKNSLDAVQIFGAYGYLKESHAEKELRDSVAATIYSGTSEIQRRIIAEQIGGGL